jgi:bifunctional UDP-N-acetylglucosamine pyrophosphorylase/glucosamine-1-phosphate N-acetyltransferase
MKKCQAIILAAGSGTRMKSSLPKVAHEILGKPMANYVIDAVTGAGIDDVVLVTGYGCEIVEEKAGKRKVTIARQEHQRGTGDAVRSAMHCVKGGKKEILVLCGDAPLIRPQTLRKLVRLHRRQGATITMLTGVLEDPTGYGRVIRDPSGTIARIVEEKDASGEEKTINEVNSGSYIFDARFLSENIDALVPDNVQKEYYLTDLVYRAFFDGKRVSGSLVPDAEEIVGINSRDELAFVAGVLSLRVTERLMNGGVTIEDPYNAYISPDVVIGADTVIEPGVIIRGETKIGKNVRVGAGSYIADSEIRQGAQILPYSVIQQATVGRGARVGPFAHLRPETVLMDDARIGNFVEVKKSRIGRGSKANHLAYVGDTTVGTMVNIGAGTITCNYDGIAKHQTVIKDGVFVGSDTQLVAPVTIGKGAVIGAGATVTDDVPAFALALSRAKQENILDWVVRKKPELIKKAGLKMPEKKRRKRG